MKTIIHTGVYRKDSLSAYLAGLGEGHLICLIGNGHEVESLWIPLSSKKLG